MAHEITAQGYVHQPLDSNNDIIRLIKFRPPQSGIISCELVCAPIPRDGNFRTGYIAASYTWTPEYPKHEILIDGYPFEIGHNLWQLFRTLCFSDSFNLDLFLWVDQICINQNDSVEKSVQVQQMGAIYEAASKVLAWLGPTEDRSDLAIQWIKNRSNWKLDHLDSSSSTALGALFRRRYWTRRWIAQEITLSCSLDFHCGNDTFDVNDLISSFHNLKSKQVNTVFPSRIIQLLGFRDVPSSLSFVMLDLKELECSVIHDRVYALLALCDHETPFITNYDEGILYVLLRILQDSPNAPIRAIAEMLEIKLTDSEIEIVSQIADGTISDAMLREGCRSTHEALKEICNSIVEIGIEKWCIQNSFTVC